MDHVEAGTVLRTPNPTDLQHCAILVKRAMKDELARPLLLLAKVAAVPTLLMLWTMGNFISVSLSDASSAAFAGEYVLYPGNEWDYPKRVVLAGAPGDSTNLSMVQDELSSFFSTVEVSSETNASDFKVELETTLVSQRAETVKQNSVWRVRLCNESRTS